MDCNGTSADVLSLIHISLFEKNEKLGKKLYITGKGRCNVTNNCDPEELLNSVVTNAKFLYSAFYTFTSQDMMEFLEEAGTALKTCLLYTSYRKPFSPYPDRQDMRELVGKPSGDGISVLLAHNPKYGDVYFEWGADFIFSGHYHGGILRFNEHHGLTCPQYLLFPLYCCGDFHRQEQHMIVSAGLGEHTIPCLLYTSRCV